MSLFQDVIHHTDVPLQLGLPAAQSFLNVLQFFNLFLGRRDLGFPFLDHPVIALGVGFIPNPFHQDGLHFFLQHGDSLLLLFDLCDSGTGLWLPLVNQLLHSLEVFLIHCLGLHQFLGDELIQEMNRLFQSLVTERQLPLALINHQHSGTICSGSLQPGLNGIRQPIFRCLVDYIDRFQRLFSLRQGLATGQCRNNRQHKSSFAFAGVSLNDRQFPSGEIRVPEPLHLLCLNLFHRNQSQIMFHPAFTTSI